MKLSDLIDILTETLSLNGDMNVVGIVDEKIYDDIEINCPDEDSPAYIELYKSDSFTAYAYEEDGIVIFDLATYDNQEEAIAFAKSHDWDEVVNDNTGEVVWRR